MVEKLQSILGQGVPLLNAVLIAVWLVGTSITLTLQWANVKTSISDLSKDQVLRDERLNSRLNFLERDSLLKDLSRWTRENHELWCAKTEQRNPEWKCGEFPSPPAYRSGGAEIWNSKPRGP